MRFWPFGLKIKCRKFQDDTPMEIRVTARKWRPQSFHDIVGQEALVQAIQNGFLTGRVPHAFLFSGIRGVGKTTTARVVAKALNCLNPGKNGEPCNTCSHCTDITSGASMDVIEIDGASNRGIDSIRQIRDNAGFMPLQCKYKVYIIDEVHMLTNEASNALLKTLEEPPAHVVFILATTESQKVLPTIKSRCQHYVFKKIPQRTMVEQLQKICEHEGFEYTEEGLDVIASAADGSMRDAESLFDQVVLYSGAKITEENAARLVGVPDHHYYETIVKAIHSEDAVSLLLGLNDYFNVSGDCRLFVRGLYQYLKQGLLARSVSDPSVIDLSKSQQEKLNAVFQGFSVDEIKRLFQPLLDIYSGLKGDVHERVLLEMALLEMLDYKNRIPLSVIRDDMLKNMASGPRPEAPARPQPQVMHRPEEPQAQSRPVQRPQAAEAPVYIKPEVKKLPEGLVKPAAVVSAPAGNAGTENAGDLLRQALSKSLIMKPMIQSILEIKPSGAQLDVVMNSGHTAEYLNKHAQELEKTITELSGRSIQLSFTAGASENPAQKAANTGVSQPTPPAPAEKKAESPRNPSAEKPVGPSQDGDLIQKTRDLFDAKLI